MASAYGQRPSALLSLDDEWAAFQLDMATLIVGREIENATADGKMKPAAVLKQMEWRAGLKPGTPEAPPPGQFRSMRGLATKRMKVPESGVW